MNTRENLTVFTESTVDLSKDVKSDALDSVLGLMVRNKIINSEEAQKIANGDYEISGNYEGYPEFDVAIQGLVIPYTCGTREDPPDGGYCEDFYVYFETQDEFKISRSKRYAEMAKKVSKSKNDKAKKLAKRFQYKSETFLEVDLTEYLTQKSEQALNEKAYEKAVEQYCRKWEEL